MNNWIRYKFNFNYPPNWWIDIFIIDTVYRDAIHNHKNNIELWRFHRRAAPDDAGHQLSFLCYTKESNLIKIEEDLFKHKSIKLLEKNSILKTKSHDLLDSKVESTSDANWPLELKKAWPHYIMGVSELILDLLLQLKSPLSVINISNLEQVEKYYYDLNLRMMQIWRNEGSHAFLHHINALFGYAPIIARPRNVQSAEVTF